MRAPSQRQERLATSLVAYPIRHTVCRCKSWLHLPGEKRIGQKRNGDDPFVFSCETIQLEKSTNDCPTSTHIIEDGKNSPLNAAFCAARPFPNSKNTGSRLAGSPPAGSQLTSKSPCLGLPVT